MREDYTWEEFFEKLCKQFGERSIVDTIEEFNKLKQIESIEAYL